MRPNSLVKGTSCRQAGACPLPRTLESTPGSDQVNIGTAFRIHCGKPVRPKHCSCLITSVMIDHHCKDVLEHFHGELVVGSLGKLRFVLCGHYEKNCSDELLVRELSVAC